MRGKAVSCGDIKRKCEIDCLLPTPETSVLYSWPQTDPMPYEKISSCTDGCATDFSSCSESDEATAALSCSYDCAKEYEGKLLACMQSLDVTTVNTVDDTMDDCANDASLVMNVCTETCHEVDVYGGWTEATEEGVAEKDMEAFLSKTIQVPNYRLGIPAYKANGRVSPTDINMAAVDNSAASSSAANVVEFAEKIGVGGIMGLSGLFAGSILAVGIFAKRSMADSSYQHEPL
jgi:hypothetical protein